MGFLHRRPKHSWYWYAFWALVFAFFLYQCARTFMKLVARTHTSTPSRNGKTKGHWFGRKRDPIEELFVGS